MSFMQIQVKYGVCITVCGPDGDDIYPLDVITTDRDEIDLLMSDLGGGYMTGGDCISEEVWYILNSVLDPPGEAELKDMEVIVEEKMWMGRLSAPGYMDCTPWQAETTEIELLHNLSRDYDAKLPKGHPGYISSCPHCGAPGEEAKLEHSYIRAHPYDQRWNPHNPRALSLDSANMVTHYMKCAACGDREIPVSALLLNIEVEGEGVGDEPEQG